MIKIELEATSKGTATLIYRIVTNIIISFIYVPAGDVGDEGVV